MSVATNHIITPNIESVLPLFSRRKDMLPRQKRPAYNTLTALLTLNDLCTELEQRTYVLMDVHTTKSVF